MPGEPEPVPGATPSVPAGASGGAHPRGGAGAGGSGRGRGSVAGDRPTPAPAIGRAGAGCSAGGDGAGGGRVPPGGGPLAGSAGNSDRAAGVEGPAGTAAERAVLLTVALATMLAPLNSTMIAVALPGIMADLGAELALAGWLVTGYLIAMATLQPVAGKLGDRLGRRPLILGALVAFGAASLAAALAPNLAVALAGRIAQGIAGAVLMPNASALLREIGSGSTFGARTGLIGAAAGLAAAVGPPLGGLLDGTLGWRAIFAVNLLLVVPTLVLGWSAVPAATGRRPARAFDTLGAGLLLVTLVGGSATLVLGGRLGSEALRIALAAAVGLAAAGLIAWEWRQADPVVQPRFFRRRAFGAANAGIALSNLAMYSTLLALPLLLRSRPGWLEGTGAVGAGLILTALSVAMVVASPLGGRLADRFGRRWPTVAGLALLTLAAGPLWWLGGAIEPAPLVGVLALMGVGLGLSGAGLQTSAMEAVGRADTGAAAGVYSTSRYLGSIVGSSLLAALLGPLGDSSTGFATVFGLVLGASVLSTAAALALVDRPSPDRP